MLDLAMLLAEHGFDLEYAEEGFLNRRGDDEDEVEETARQLRRLRMPEPNVRHRDERMVLLMEIAGTDDWFAVKELLEGCGWDLHAALDRWMTTGLREARQGPSDQDHKRKTFRSPSEMHDGWLTDEALRAALTIGTSAQDTYVVPPAVWAAFQAGVAPPPVIPESSQALNLVVPVHWGNHWALLYIDATNWEISYLDSQEQTGRRRRIEELAEAFLGANPLYNPPAGLGWMYTDRMSECTARKRLRLWHACDCQRSVHETAWCPSTFGEYESPQT